MKYEDSDPIRGRVAAILDKLTLIINRGSSHGVEVGMEFNIQLDLPAIYDPEDPTIKLDGLSYVKGRANVTRVQDQMSICSLLPSRRKRNVSALFGLTEALSSETVDVFPKVAEGQILIPDTKWDISVGDSVIQSVQYKLA